MKALVILVIATLFNLSVNAQENPWKTKTKKNPWTGYEKKKTESDTAKVKTVIIDTVKTQKTIDSTKLKVVEINETEIAFLTVEEQNRLYGMAESEAKENYDSKTDFAIGFFTGLTLNMLALPVAAVASQVTIKPEQKAVVETIENEKYENVDREILEKKTRKSIRQKRLGSGLAGVILGTAAQITALIILL